MPHIHTETGQHDLTTSAYIVMGGGETAKCLVHFHRKLHTLMQIGGHVELDETPWQAIAHELKEESGYELEQLHVLQPTSTVAQSDNQIVHPVPVSINTHAISGAHYHTDLCYAFVAEAPPRGKQAAGESDDVRWLTLGQRKDSANNGEALADVYRLYRVIVAEYLDTYHQIPATSYSLDSPRILNTGLTRTQTDKTS